MPGATLADLVADRTVDAELAALLWLLAEGRVPLIVTGEASLEERTRLAEAVLSADPSGAWVLLDAESEPPTPARLAAHLQGGVGLSVTLAATDLRDLIERLQAPPHGLPEDAVRRLGIVLVASSTERGLRLAAVHYLRPTERDAEGHIQRRPPAVLATWDADADGYEHFAWAITPELADRVDRSQADLEERQRSRATFLAQASSERSMAEAGADGPTPEAGGDRPTREAWLARVAEHLEAEPPRVPAPEHERARSSPFHGGLTDPPVH